MAKSKDTELEFLRGENRKLKAEVRNLKKDISRKTKRESSYLDLEEKLAEQMVQEEQEEVKLLNKKICSKCKGTNLDVTDLGVRVLILCDDCGSRQIIKNKKT